MTSPLCLEPLGSRPAERRRFNDTAKLNLISREIDVPSPHNAGDFAAVTRKTNDAISFDSYSIAIIQYIIYRAHPREFTPTRILRARSKVARALQRARMSEL